MKSHLEHKGYVGSINYSPSSNLYYGQITEINDLVSYHGDSVTELEVAFIQAVDDYIQCCHDLGKEPNKPSKQTN